MSVHRLFGLRPGQKVVPDYLDCKFLNDQAAIWRDRCRGQAAALRTLRRSLGLQRDLRARYGIADDIRAAEGGLRESWRIYRRTQRDAGRLCRAYLARIAREAAARERQAA